MCFFANQEYDSSFRSSHLYADPKLNIDATSNHLVSLFSCSLYSMFLICSPIKYVLVAGNPDCNGLSLCSPFGVKHFGGSTLFSARTGRPISLWGHKLHQTLPEDWYIHQFLEKKHKSVLICVYIYP